MSDISLAIYEENELRVSGRICTTRVDFVTLDSVACRFDYSSVRVLGSNSGVIQQGGHDVGNNPSIDEYLRVVMPFFVVERRRNKTEQDLVTRYYTLDDKVVSYLSSQLDETLVEDGELCRFALSALSPQAGVDPLQFYVQRIRPLESENSVLRQALGLSKDEPFRDVDVLKRKGKPLRSAMGSSTTSTTHNNSSRVSAHHTPATTVVTVEQGTQTESRAHLSVAAPVADAFSVHSPHQWEQETDAAINARTKYEPFRSHSPTNHKLDLFTQQHLVVRLHDQSIDMLRSRRTGGSPTPNDEACRTLTMDEQRDLGERLHDLQQKHSAKVLEELSSLHKPNTAARTVMTSDEIKASNERIYNQPMEKKKVNMEKLLQKYVFDEEEKLSKVKLSLERQKAMADRLSKK